MCIKVNDGIAKPWDYKLNVGFEIEFEEICQTFSRHAMLVLLGLNFRASR